MIDNFHLQVVAVNSKYDKSKAKALGEVFTPPHLIKDMLRQLPKDVWHDPNRTWFDPCAGVGNFPAYIVYNLMHGLVDVIPNEKARYKHIMERQIFMSEYQEESAWKIWAMFTADAEDVKLNLHVGDTLTMPEDFFDLDYNERFFKYPERCLKLENP